MPEGTGTHHWYPKYNRQNRTEDPLEMGHGGEGGGDGLATGREVPLPGLSPKGPCGCRRDAFFTYTPRDFRVKGESTVYRGHRAS